jgi:hypothetical protein
MESGEQFSQERERIRPSSVERSGSSFILIALLAERTNDRPNRSNFLLETDND